MLLYNSVVVIEIHFLPSDTKRSVQEGYFKIFKFVAWYDYVDHPEWLMFVWTVSPKLTEYHELNRT